MTVLQTFSRAYAEVRVPRLFTWALMLAFVASIFSPPSLDKHPSKQNFEPVQLLVDGVENYGRFVNTALQIGVPLLLMDKVGLAQLVMIGIASTIATHGVKHLVNDWVINGVRLGQRPSGTNSKHNTPSGHSSLASSAVYFLARRYSYYFLIITVPVLLLTMLTRMALDAHTVSGVVSGALIGLLIAALFTSRFPSKKTQLGAQIILS
ncbi:phosphatase PAP2 family protein [Herbaspirillum aquaticum]|uniref:phosphatase PAP2 family protein n=1 Tax=Herbaspirillum aquaticum TaxID=568783 RepID=UPI0024DE9E1F|nr:phosphatase PAP2 family protein [Herbaspirillum aquaticum]